MPKDYFKQQKKAKVWIVYLKLESKNEPKDQTSKTEKFRETEETQRKKNNTNKKIKIEQRRKI